jgi:hypothetical protein
MTAPSGEFRPRSIVDVLREARSRANQDFLFDFAAVMLDIVRLCGEESTGKNIW